MRLSEYPRMIAELEAEMLRLDMSVADLREQWERGKAQAKRDREVWDCEAPQEFAAVEWQKKAIVVQLNQLRNSFEAAKVEATINDCMEVSELDLVERPRLLEPEPVGKTVETAPNKTTGNEFWKYPNRS